MSVKILVGDCRHVLASIDPGSVHCVVTSPPYFGLRDYGTGTWEGGDQACGHVVGEMRRGLGLADSVVSVRGGGHKAAEVENIKAKDVCPHCDARRVDSQIGLELRPAEYVEQIVAVMREVRRVLVDDGVLWLNLGDSYARSDAKGGSGFGGKNQAYLGDNYARAHADIPPGLKAKDLIGIPWRVAFALQEDGWYLRQDIIWSKPNPMPESVTDRCTKAHEYIFLLSKSERYFFDAGAIAEPSVYADSGRSSAGPDDLDPDRKRNDRTVGASFRAITQTRNKRSVWTVATRPFTEAHFATFPPALIEPCILAGTSERGHCPTCGARWSRVVEKIREKDPTAGKSAMRGAGSNRENDSGKTNREGREFQRVVSTETTWEPGCDCGAEPVPDVVLDPFGGAGTTALVADQNKRDAIIVELNPEYAEMASRRITADAGMFAEVS